MGYRHYFYLVNIEDCDAVRNMTYTQLAEHCKEKYPDSYDNSDDEPYINFHDILNQTEIFEFGKLYWDDTADRIYSHGMPLFSNAETQSEFDDYRPYRMGKDGLLQAIQIYQNKVISYYEGLLVDGAVQRLPFGISIELEDIKSIDKLVEHIQDEIKWWKILGVLDLDEGNERISKSWLYEHQVFELVRLYKSIDWDKKCLLFYGW